MNDPTKHEMRARLQEAADIIFEVEKVLDINSDLRKFGYRARIEISEFQNQILWTKDEEIPYKK
jgi:hypothetical protein